MNGTLNMKYFATMQKAKKYAIMQYDRLKEKAICAEESENG